MSREILEAMHALAREKGIEPEKLMIALEDALLSAYKKQPGSAKYARVEMDRDTADFRVIELIIPERLEAHLIVETIDEETTIDPETGEMREPEEPEIDPKKFAEYRDQIDERDVTPDDFGRIAAQTAKQVILQRIREAERDMMYEEYRDRVGELITGIVQQSDSRYTLVQLRERVEALLPKSEQVEGERYDHSQRIKAVIKEVSPSTKGPAIIVSRRDPELIKKLFELEVPEIADGLVEIANVAREPGYRSKIAVISHTDGVDPVGACVGPRGSRVRMVVSELRGEKIDIIPFNDEPARFVAKALSPRARARGARRRRRQAGDGDRPRRPALAGDRPRGPERAPRGAPDRLARGHPLGDRVRRRGGRARLRGGRGQRPLRRDPLQRPPLPQRRAARLALLRPRQPPGAREHRLRQRRRPRRRGLRRGGAAQEGAETSAADEPPSRRRLRRGRCRRQAPRPEIRWRPAAPARTDGRRPGAARGAAAPRIPRRPRSRRHSRRTCPDGAASAAGGSRRRASWCVSPSGAPRATAHAAGVSSTSARRCPGAAPTLPRRGLRRCPPASASRARCAAGRSRVRCDRQ